ncbi:MAG: rhomboid family intramembrane serine protease [Lachnospiraceae bacterium]|nr:rhomboid family intramembrane serine protease [Lachnospiraceae bacterium]
MYQFRWDRLPKATVTLVAANVLYFLYLSVFGSSLDTGFMIEKGALYAPLVLERQEFYRLFTAMFMHFGLEHIFFNMLLLYFLGDIIEREMGVTIFLFSYFVTGLCGNVASLLYYAVSPGHVVSAGASGAIFGLVGMIAYMVYCNRGYFRGISSRQIILMVAFSLYSGFTGSDVNNISHVVGLIAGVLCGMIFYRE